MAAELENHVFAESVTAGMGGKVTAGGVIQLNRRGGGGGEKGGWQPLIWASRACHVQIAEELLIRNSAKVNEQETASSHSSKCDAHTSPKPDP